MTMDAVAFSNVYPIATPFMVDRIVEHEPGKRA